MKLNFKKTGEGKPLFILHGLFGMSDNWGTLSKVFAENGFACYAVDQRNHGRSPHSEEFSYQLMADDLLALMNDEALSSASILGHSMGGKTAMFFACSNPERTDKLVVADIAPRYYPPHHDAVLLALHSMNSIIINSRKDVETQLRLHNLDEATVQFLLKNLYWNDENKLAWRFNFSSIEKNIKAVGEALEDDAQFNKPTLFVHGERSNYIREGDELLIKKHFPNAEIKTISKAGHWVHAENPNGFMEVVLEFLKR